MGLKSIGHVKVVSASQLQVYRHRTEPLFGAIQHAFYCALTAVYSGRGSLVEFYGVLHLILLGVGRLLVSNRLFLIHPSPKPSPQDHKPPPRRGATVAVICKCGIIIGWGLPSYSRRGREGIQREFPGDTVKTGAGSHVITLFHPEFGFIGAILMFFGGYSLDG